MSGSAPDALDDGRAAFQQKRWRDAVAALSAADDANPLDPDDLVLLAQAKKLIGRELESIDLLARAHAAFLREERPDPAARCAVWAGMEHMNRGEMAQAGGWFSRAERLLQDGRDCVELGYIILPRALQTLFGGDPDAALPLFLQATAIAERFGDADLSALCRLGRGSALVALGRIGEGLGFVDEAMLSVVAGEVGPIQSGIVYCAAIELCQEIFDLRRAREWTTALGRWIDAQSDLVPFRGQCLVHRAAIMQLHGEWPNALQEAEQAERWLSDPPSPAVGAAHYQLGEIHRLRGDLAEAEECYRRASMHGRDPQPGMALMRLAQGQLDVAAASIKREVSEVHDPVTRGRFLPALVEIALAAGDLPAARAAAEEVASIATLFDSAMLRAHAAHAEGAVSLEESDALGAIASLRRAAAGWQDLGARYEAARTRFLIALACRQLGDGDAAELEMSAARDAFDRLGAAPALAWVDDVWAAARGKASGVLTDREIEVLRLVASGKTNRAIASELVLSEKTVARHVSNIFTKLDVSSRAAATAYAYEHGLV